MRTVSRHALIQNFNLTTGRPKCFFLVMNKDKHHNTITEGVDFHVKTVSKDILIPCLPSSSNVFYCVQSDKHFNDTLDINIRKDALLF
ncbi:hypothetical protein CAEBREN_04812 [Caenorhabditis brenneri]|uniref:Uncharacterized protein n=1 Tax=Caenorhabditis brenneri TaxID=135651 RepID=G0PHA2_CAEBE|nr:hypothetical protein CAEBREN_04812 [Caenorhabditis brenneri]